MLVSQSEFFGVIIQFKPVWTTTKISLWLLLAAGGELVISDLNPYRLFPQNWRLIRNDPDALVSAFTTIMIVTGLNVPVVIDHHDKLLLLYLKHVVVA